MALMRMTERSPRHAIRAFAAAFLAFAALAFAPTPAKALGPHEIVLVVNEESVDSIVLARVYKRLRSIPDSNLIRLSIPRNVYDGNSTAISPADFTKYIWEPLDNAIERAGLTRQVLAVVFSCGFPTRVTTPEQISLTGAVFMRGKFPSAEIIKNGSYVSELYAGPSSAEAPIEDSETFETSRSRLLSMMPLPAMMLSFTGTNGATVAKAIKQLERAAASDYTKPQGTVWIAKNEDIRSLHRHWQFAAVTNALSKKSGFRAILSTEQPSESDFPLSGYMTGSRTVNAPAFQFVPGAFAEHLTSFGAAFHRPTQTKITEWLDNGAAFSSGAIEEPYAIWMKFPHACIFVHYANGCTAIESFYQSVRCPLQTLPLGDPLANPWGEAIEVRIDAPEAPLSGLVEFNADILNERTDTFYRFQWLVNDILVSTGRTFVWDTRATANGVHKIRLIARHQLERVKPQGFAEIQVTVDNKK